MSRPCLPVRLEIRYRAADRSIGICPSGKGRDLVDQRRLRCLYAKTKASGEHSGISFVDGSRYCVGLTGSALAAKAVTTSHPVGLYRSSVVPLDRTMQVLCAVKVCQTQTPFRDGSVAFNLHLFEELETLVPGILRGETRQRVSEKDRPILGPRGRALSMIGVAVPDPQRRIQMTKKAPDDSHTGVGNSAPFKRRAQPGPPPRKARLCSGNRDLLHFRGLFYRTFSFVIVPNDGAQARVQPLNCSPHKKNSLPFEINSFGS